MEPSSVEKIYEIDCNIGAAMSGLSSDSKTIIEHARVESQNHRFLYNEPMKVESLTQSVCDLALQFGDMGDGNQKKIMSRPFGAALLIGGVDGNGCHLFHADPSGTFMRYEAKAIGAGSEGAQTQLQEEYDKSMSLIDAEMLALRILKQVMEEKLNENNIQFATITESNGYQVYSSTQVLELISKLSE